MSVFDVAKYILNQLAPGAQAAPITAWKLQKLVYYCQAWSLVWDEAPIFDEPIQAWANGPVCPALYAVHRGQFYVCAPDIQGNPDALSDDAKATVDAVLSHYGNKSGQWLRDATHAEAPWREARGDCSPGEPSNNVITLDSMAAYYSSI